MINKLLVCIGTLFVVHVTHADQAQEVFAQAHEQYAAQHYQKALELYSIIDNKGCAVWHNMGNCACRLKQPVDAIAYWRKAQQGCCFAEYDELQKNIDGVYGQMGKQSLRSPWRKFTDKIVGRFSAIWYQVIFLLLWGLLFVLIRRRETVRKGALLVVMPLTMMMGLCVVEKYRSQKMVCALVAQQAVSLFSGPDSNYQAIGSVALADEVSVVDQRGDWCKVEVGGLAGWVLVDTLKKL